VLLVVPFGVVTETGPLVTPTGAVAVICVPETTVNDAEAPLKLTLVAPVNPEPVRVTTVPARPLSGESEDRVGGGLGAGAGGGAVVVTVKDA
jgi:hypothetical protein